jgi:hypothetical protein
MPGSSLAHFLYNFIIWDFQVNKIDAMPYIGFNAVGLRLVLAPAFALRQIAAARQRADCEMSYLDFGELGSRRVRLPARDADEASRFSDQAPRELP